MPSNASTIILGIDPGIADTGYAVLERRAGTFIVHCYGSIKTPKTVAIAERLNMLADELKAIILKYQPNTLSIEKLFFAKNVTTAMTVGQARGVVMMLAGKHGLTIREFTPLQVKVAITGYGSADKKQMQQMVKLVLKLTEIPKPDDAADALAIAICCGNQTQQ